MNTSDIKKIKLTLGDIEILDYRRLDIVDAHEKLGEEVSAQATKILEDKIVSLGRIGLNEEAKFAQQILENLEEKSKSPEINTSIQNAIKMYLRCISSWARGAGFEKYIVEKGLGNLVSPQMLAIFLQNDNTGCQTGVFRREGGSIVIWHTEEDERAPLSERFDKLRLAIFHSDLNSSFVDIFSFIYPDLLPGAAFNWRSDGYFQSVDSIYLDQDKNAFMLANTICWLTLVIGQNIPTQTIFNSLKPISDGYALNIVFSGNDVPKAEKMEFARDHCVISVLAERPNSFLFQVNLFSDLVSPDLKQFENISDHEKLEYLNRRQRTSQYIANISSSKNIRNFHNLLTSRVGSPYCYASPWVKSYILASLDIKKLEVWVGSGPALRNDILHQFSYEF